MAILLSTNASAASFGESWEKAEKGVMVSPNGAPLTLSADSGLWTAHFNTSLDSLKISDTGGIHISLETRDPPILLHKTGLSIPLHQGLSIVLSEWASVIATNASQFFPTFAPPPCDNVNISVRDNKGNRLVYVIQRPEGYSAHAARLLDNIETLPDGTISGIEIGYREVFLGAPNTPGATFIRNLYDDFLQIPGFISSNAYITSVTIENNARGVAHFDDIVIDTAIPTIAPRSIGAPVSIEAPVGGRATLSSAFTGTFLTYQWFRAESPIIGATNSALDLKDLQYGLEGIYTVVASNVYGSARSAPTTLILKTPTPDEPLYTKHIASLTSGGAFVLSENRALLQFASGKGIAVLNADAPDSILLPITGDISDVTLMRRREGRIVCIGRVFGDIVINNQLTLTNIGGSRSAMDAFILDLSETGSIFGVSRISSVSPDYPGAISSLRAPGSRWSAGVPGFELQLNGPAKLQHSSGGVADLSRGHYSVLVGEQASLTPITVDFNNIIQYLGLPQSSFPNLYLGSFRIDRVDGSAYIGLVMRGSIQINEWSYTSGATLASEHVLIHLTKNGIVDWAMPSPAFFGDIPPVVDDFGFLYLCGQQTVTSAASTSSAGPRIFKISNGGDVVWSKHLGSPTSTLPSRMVAGPRDEIYIAVPHRYFNMSFDGIVLPELPTFSQLIMKLDQGVSNSIPNHVVVLSAPSDPDDIYYYRLGYTGSGTMPLRQWWQLANGKGYQTAEPFVLVARSTENMAGPHQLKIVNSVGESVTDFSISEFSVPAGNLVNMRISHYTDYVGLSLVMRGQSDVRVESSNDFTNWFPIYERVSAPLWMQVEDPLTAESHQRFYRAKGAIRSSRTLLESFLLPIDGDPKAWLSAEHDRVEGAKMEALHSVEAADGKYLSCDIVRSNLIRLDSDDGFADKYNGVVGGALFRAEFVDLPKWRGIVRTNGVGEAGLLQRYTSLVQKRLDQLRAWKQFYLDQDLPCRRPGSVAESPSEIKARKQHLWNQEATLHSEHSAILTAFNETSIAIAPKPLRPRNDDFVDRFPLYSMGVWIFASIANASIEPEETRMQGSSSIWFQWQPKQTGTVSIQIGGEGLTKPFVLKGTSISGLKESQGVDTVDVSGNHVWSGDVSSHDKYVVRLSTTNLNGNLVRLRVDYTK